MPQRIAIVIDPWDHPFNGTVVSTRRFAAALMRRGVEIRLLTIGTGAATDPANRLQRIGFEALRIPGVDAIIDAMRSPLARPQRSRIRAALAGCELVHVQYPFFLGRAALREAVALGVPVVCSFHVQPENILSNLGVRGAALSRLLYRLFRHVFYDRADRVVAPSEFAAELLRGVGLRTPVSVVSNGVPERFLRAPRLPASADGSIRILSVGRLAREKQQAVLIEAVARSRHRQRIELHLVGAGPMAEPLRRIARRLGVRAAIGPLDDGTLLERYRGADLFVHCGAVELEGMSVLEAMATGNAVIVAASPASASCRLVDGPMARFTPRNTTQLAERIDHWLDDPAARQALGHANRAHAAAYGHDRCVTALLDVYVDVLRGARGDACRSVGTGAR